MFWTIEELVLCGCDHHSNALLAYVAERAHTALQHFVWSGFGGKVTAMDFRILHSSAGVFPNQVCNFLQFLWLHRGCEVFGTHMMILYKALSA